MEIFRGEIFMDFKRIFKNKDDGSNKKKKVFGRILLGVLVVILSGTFLMNLIQPEGATDRRAYPDGRDNGKSQIFSSGYVWFEISGGPNNEHSLIPLYISRSSAPSWKTFNSQSTTWNVRIVTNSAYYKNEHNVQLRASTLNTLADTTPEYNTFSIPLSYDMPAHYV